MLYYRLRTYRPEDSLGSYIVYIVRYDGYSFNVDVPGKYRRGVGQCIPLHIRQDHMLWMPKVKEKEKSTWRN